MPDNPYKTDVSKLAGLIAEAKTGKLIIFGKACSSIRNRSRAVYD